MADDTNKKVWVQFAPGEPAPPKDDKGEVRKGKDGQPLRPSATLEISQGEYRRTFNVQDQPFECDPEEAAWLLREGHFVELPPVEKKAAARLKTGDGAATGSETPKV